MLRPIATILALALAASAGFGQKKPERPKLHSDFYFGSYPSYRDAGALMAQENARLLLVGFHQGWELSKIAKESKIPEDELSRLLADLEEQKLVFEVDEYETRPEIPVIRDRDLDKVQMPLFMHRQELSNILQNNWQEIETFAASLAGAKAVPRPQLMYQLVVAGILFGGMNDAFFEDQTFMPPPPRREGGQRYYGWLVEGDPKLAGVLKREAWESEGHSMVSIGTELQKDRMTLAQIRSGGAFVLDDAESRRVRSFVAIFSRDKLLPFFKKYRSEFIKVVRDFEAGKYVRVADVFSWYYDQIANGVVDDLIKNKRVEPPVTQYTFALKLPAR